MTIENFKARLFAPVTLLFFGVFMSFALQAQTEPQKAPQKVVEETVNAIVKNIQVNRDLYKKDKPAFYKMFEETLIPALHMPRMSKLILGRKAAGKSTPAQRDAFAKEFEASLIYTYSLLLLEFIGDDKVVYGDVVMNDSGDKAVVNATFVSSTGASYAMIMYMSNRGDTRWRAYNLEVNGQDAVRTFRSTYSAIIEKKGVDGLVADLRKSNSELAKIWGRDED